jgi:hypothetical protein
MVVWVDALGLSARAICPRSSIETVNRCASILQSPSCYGLADGRVYD